MEGRCDFEGVVRDLEIRAMLHRWLEVAHRGDPEAGVIDELRIPRPSARADVALINGEMVGFEIKSEADSLCRLPRQVRAFDNVFDRSFVVTATRHLEQLNTTLSPWWGILLAKRQGGFSELEVVREASANPRQDVVASLYLLRKAEILRILDVFGGGAGLRSKRHEELVAEVASRAPIHLLKVYIRRALRTRAYARTLGG